MNIRDLRNKYPRAKPYNLARVTDPAGFAYIGEVMSYPTPDETVMVRRVPDHPCLLVEVPLSRVEFDERSAKRIKYVHYAVVRRVDLLAPVAFPVDMLRYEEAAPVNFKLVDDDRPMLLQPEYPEDFMIAAATAYRRPGWTAARWESFGWEIEPHRTCSLVEVRQ
jgi:hypothetical protein